MYECDEYKAETPYVFCYIYNIELAAFKAAEMSETAFETQAAFVTRGLGGEAFSLEHESLEGLERNADLRLHIFSHEVVQK